MPLTPRQKKIAKLKTSGDVFLFNELERLEKKLPDLKQLISLLIGEEAVRVETPDMDIKKKIAKLSDDSDFFLFKEIQALEEQIPDITALAESFKLKKGEKGDKGDSVNGEKGDAGRDGVDGKDGKDGINGKDGKQGVAGQNGLPGVDGKDGKEIKPEEIADKLNTLKDVLDYSVMKGTPDLVEFENKLRSSLPIQNRGGGSAEILSNGEKVMTTHRLNFGSNITVTKDGGTVNIDSLGGGNFADLDDVDVTGVTPDQSIKWNGTDWVNYTPTDLDEQTLQSVTDFGATTTNTTTFSPTGNNDGIIANGMGSGSAIVISHAGSGDQIEGDGFDVDRDGDITAKSFITTGGTSADFVKGDGSLGTVDLSGYVPYTGATTDVDLGANDLNTDRNLTAGEILPETIGSSANATISFTGDPGYFYFGEKIAMRVYAYKTVGGTRIFSDTPAQSAEITVTTPYKAANFTWDAVAGAEGYRVFFYYEGIFDSYNYDAFKDYVTNNVDTTYLFTGNFGTEATSAIPKNAPSYPSDHYVRGKLNVNDIDFFNDTPTLSKQGDVFLFADSTKENTAFGESALLNSNSEGIQNLAIGFEALKSSTSGRLNVAMGYRAGASLTTAIDNILLGYKAGESITTGGENTAIGGTAGINITTGNQNTLVGYSAGRTISTGIRNILIGRYAGSSINTGSNNIMIGLNGTYVTSGSNNIFIDPGGAGFFGNDPTISNYLLIGKTIYGNTSTKKISIGTETITAGLSVVNTTEQFRAGYDASNYWNATTGSSGITTFNAVGSSAKFIFSDAVEATTLKTSGLGTAALPAYSFTGDTNTGLWSPTADTLAWSTGGSERMRVISSGDVGIGTTSPNQKLEVAGNVRSSGYYQMFAAGGVNAFFGTGSLISGGASTDFAMRSQGGNILFSDNGNVETMRLASGNLGIGTGSTISARLHAISTTEQLRLGYNASIYGTIAISSGGDMNINVTGDEIDYHYGKAGNAYLDVGQLGTSGTKYLRIFDNTAQPIVFASNADSYINNSANFGVATPTPTARLHLGAGTATEGKAPLKLTSGTNLTTPEDGAFEFDGTNLYFTVGGVRKTVTLT